MSKKEVIYRVIEIEARTLRKFPDGAGEDVLSFVNGERYFFEHKLEPHQNLVGVACLLMKAPPNPGGINNEIGNGSDDATAVYSGLISNVLHLNMFDNEKLEIYKTAINAIDFDHVGWANYDNDDFFGYSMYYNPPILLSNKFAAVQPTQDKYIHGVVEVINDYYLLAGFHYTALPKAQIVLKIEQDV